MPKMYDGKSLNKGLKTFNSPLPGPASSPAPKAAGEGEKVATEHDYAPNTKKGGMYTGPGPNEKMRK